MNENYYMLSGHFVLPYLLYRRHTLQIILDVYLDTLIVDLPFYPFYSFFILGILGAPLWWLFAYTCCLLLAIRNSYIR